MRRLLLALIICMSACVASWAGNNYASTVERMLREYPYSTLRDVYKSFFQDRFGPGHLLVNPEAALSYLHLETQEMGDNPLPFYEPAGQGRNYYRVNLMLIKDSIVPEQVFAEAFLGSASKVKFPPIDKWEKEWHQILEHVPDTLPGYQVDRAYIDSLLSTGNYAVHHSRLYNQHYNPHYRLIDKKTFKDKILKYLPKEQRQ